MADGDSQLSSVRIFVVDDYKPFRRWVFEVKHDDPDQAQVEAMRSAKLLIFQGLQVAQPKVTSGRIGVLVDERYGESLCGDALRTCCGSSQAEPGHFC